MSCTGLLWSTFFTWFLFLFCFFPFTSTAYWYNLHYDTVAQFAPTCFLSQHPISRALFKIHDHGLPLCPHFTFDPPICIYFHRLPLLYFPGLHLRISAISLLPGTYLYGTSMPQHLALGGRLCTPPTLLCLSQPRKGMTLYVYMIAHHLDCLHVIFYFIH